MKKYIAAENVQLVQSGDNYFNLLEEIINQSKITLHLQMYIFETDTTGLRIVNALKQAAARNVSVFILLDAFGSYSFSREIVQELLLCGIRFRFFSPLFSFESGYFGRRLHYKLIVADKKTSLTGGINIADKYNINSSEAPWLDYALLIKGKVCEYLHFFCEEMYQRKRSDALQLLERNLLPPDAQKEKVKIRFRVNDWLKRKNEIQKSYLESISNARKSITIISSYFLPNRILRQQLTKASSRGVEIKILLTKKSDVWSAKLAENYLYDFYLRNKIRLYEWNNSILHAKVMIVDDNWVTIGSYNLNFLSHYISIELNTDVSNITFANKLTKHVEQIITDDKVCNEINKNEKKNNRMVQLKMWLFYTFYFLLMNIIVSKKRQRKLN